ncbi:MAG TPA: hypothetical protein VN903_38090 [Polyangia bacterium]|nr:hypothetical protein [Polyangia bacterium]
MRGTAPACAFVKIGFDRRGWPTNTSNQAFDNMTRVQADDLRKAAPPGASPRVYTQPGQDTMFALFDGDGDDVVLARCKQAVAAYLPKAPRMPLIGQGSATHVIVPCQPCR